MVDSEDVDDEADVLAGVDEDEWRYGDVWMLFFCFLS